MRIVHVPFCFTPDPVGGTEVYVANLARDLKGLGVDAMVAAPSETSRTYMIDGLPVHRFAVSNKVTDVSQLYGPGDLLAAAEFAKILDETRPDLVHLHAFTWAVSLRLVDASKTRGVPIVFTYHTPTASCQRGTFLLWGQRICDGKLDLVRCSGCTLHGLGMYRPLAAQIGRLPPLIGRWLGDHGLQGGIWTALRTSELINMRHAAFRRMASEVDHIVAVCKWVQDVILENGISVAKVSLARHGINWIPDQRIEPISFRAGGAPGDVRIAFVGRLDPTKGLHILINAFQMVPTLKVRLDVYGVVQNSANAAYKKEMLALAGGDSRISFLEPIASPEVVHRLRRYDFLAVPSQWIETGPLVALEAFAAGTPVIGWNVGGVGEIVRDGVDGLLIEPGSSVGWVEALRRVTEDAKLRAKLKAGVRPPRTSLEVAREMLGLYDSLIRSRATPQRECVPN
jgi:glycosyltransferase involved in cell wall biosynthesis